VVDLTESSQWKKLEEHCSAFRGASLQDLINDQGRVESLSFEVGDIFFDFSKQLLSSETLHLLADLADQVGLERQIEGLFGGAVVNQSENRPALHTALRMPPTLEIEVDGRDVIPLIQAAHRKAEEFAMKIRAKEWLGVTGRPISSVVNIGIGGSHLGPYMAFQALRPYCENNVNCYFISNLDPADLVTNLSSLDPETTLFIINSKSFSTSETLTNTESAMEWVENALGIDSQILQKHFVAVTANKSKAESYGFAPENIFPIWDWVGGRFSVSSATSLAVMVAVGPDNFKRMLEGCRQMDEHFQASSLTENIPALMGLISLWNRNFLGYSSSAVIPYSQDFMFFPAYLEQLEMESNGKNIDREGNLAKYETGPAILGGVGTNAQHSIFQFLHQGTSIIPVDFIAFANPSPSNGTIDNDVVSRQHEALLANCFAQSQGLAIGDPEANGTFSSSGNRPSSTILADRLDPFTLGQLIALYEHKVFTMGAVWQINSFDQWGVELGKSLVNNVASNLAGIPTSSGHDSSTTSLVARYRKRQDS